VVGEHGAEGGHGLVGPLAGGVGPEEERDGAAVQLPVGLRLAGFETGVGVWSAVRRATAWAGSA